MADPAGSVAGFISLSLDLYDRISTYLNAIKSRDADITTATQRCDTLRAAVSVIQSTIPKLPSSDPAAAAAANNAVDACLTRARELQSFVDELDVAVGSGDNYREVVRATKTKMLYPFRRDTLLLLETRLDMLNSSLGIALQVLGLDTTTVLTHKLETVETIATETRDKTYESHRAVLELKQAAADDLVKTAMVGDQVNSSLQRIEGIIQDSEPILFHIKDSLASTTVALENVNERIVEVQQTASATSACSTQIHDRLAVDLPIIQDKLMRVEEKICGPEPWVPRLDSSQIQALQTATEHVVQRALAPLVEHMERLNLPPDSTPRETATVVRLAGKPGLLRDVSNRISEAAGTDLALWSKGSKITIRPKRRKDVISERLPDSDDFWYCSCRANGLQLPRTIRTQRHTRWGSLDLLSQRVNVLRHYPGCKFHAYNPGEQSRTIGVTFLRLASIFSRALTISMTTTSGAGGFALPGVLVATHVVDRRTHPIFRHLNNYIHIMDPRRTFSDLTIEIREKWQFLRRPYIDRRASPHDVDTFGNNVVFYLIREWGYAVDNDTSAAALREVLLDLRNLGAKFMTTDISGETSLCAVELSMGPEFRLHDINTRGGAQRLIALYDLMDEVSDEIPFFGGNVLFSTPTERMRFLESIQERPDIAEALGCGPLSIAVLQKSTSRCQKLVESEHSCSLLSERDDLGQTALHLAHNWPQGLRILDLARCKSLLQPDVTHPDISNGRANNLVPLLDTPDHWSLSPVAHSLVSSELICTAKDRWTECTACHCSTTVSMFLDAGCAIDLHKIISRISIGETSFSYKAAKVLFSSMAGIARRLQDIARQVLQPAELESINIQSGELLDPTDLVWETLSKYCPASVPKLRTGSGIYHSIRDVRDAEICYSLGFKDIDIKDIDGHSPLIGQSVRIIAFCEATQPLEYCSWLVNKGADLTTRRWCRETVLPCSHSVTHYLAPLVGETLNVWDWMTNSTARPPFSRDALDLIVKILTSQDRDGCMCRCSSSGGCLPIKQFMCHLQEGRSWPFPPACVLFHYITVLRYHLVYLGNLIKVAAPIIRYLTFSSLGLRHTCCHWTLPSQTYKFSRRHNQDIDDVLEIQEEERHLINLLEELLEGFQEDYVNFTGTLFEFIEGPWMEKMDNVLERLNSWRMPSEQLRDLKEIGIILEDAGIGAESKEEDD